VFVSATISNIFLLFHFMPVSYFFTQNSLNRSQNEEELTWPLFGRSGSLALVLKYKR